jgi:hypothetical protein
MHQALWDLMGFAYGGMIAAAIIAGFRAGHQ